MSKSPTVRGAALAVLLALLGGFAGIAPAMADEVDPPGRVARVNLLDGTGALQPAGTDSWVGDLRGRPLTGGDKLWIDARSRAELHVGSSALRLGEQTALQVLAIDDQVVRLRMTAGSLSVRLRSLYEGETFEIETPAGDIALVQPGGYRIDVDDHEERARVAVWSGRAEVSGPSGTSIVRSDESAQLTGGDDAAIEVAAAGRTDSLDLWAEDRDRREDQSRAAQYVSRDVVGYEELDGYGDWVVDPVYGSVWVPQVVAVDWAPYRFGYWSYIGPWGWTWIDDAPWGFAPCHYGRWVHARHGWAWAPGEREEHRRPVFAPALVAWRGDRYPRPEGPDRDPRHDREHGGRVGWVPLGYNEVYEPPFHASRDYLRAVNQTNTHLGRNDLERYLDKRGAGGNGNGGGGGADEGRQRRYANEAVPGAYTEVSRETFTSARPVGRNRVAIDPAQPQLPLTSRPPDVRPDARSIGRQLPADRPVARPDRSVFERPVMGRDGARRQPPVLPSSPAMSPGATAQPLPQRPPMIERRVEPAPVQRSAPVPTPAPTPEPRYAPQRDDGRTWQRPQPTTVDRPRPEAGGREWPGVREAPVREAPVREVPVREVPVREVPVREAPVREAPVERPVMRDTRPVFSAPPAYRPPAPPVEPRYVPAPVREARPAPQAPAPSAPAPSAPSGDHGDHGDRRVDRRSERY